MYRLYVTVIGSSGRIPPKVYEAAYQVGFLLAKSGAVLVTGGKDGVMEAACRGAKDAGGLTVGLLPEKTRALANPYVDIAIPTGLGYYRNVLNILAGDGAIAIGGGPGTLSEIGLALAYGRPVVVLKTAGGVSELLAGRTVGDVKIASASTPEEAVETLLEILGASSVTSTG